MDIEDLFSFKSAAIFFVLMIPLFILSAMLSIGLEFLPFIVLGVGGIAVGAPKGFQMLAEHWDKGEMTHMEYLMNPGGLEGYEQFIDQAQEHIQEPIELPSPRQGRIESSILQALVMQKQQKFVESSPKLLPDPDDLNKSDEIMHLGSIIETGEPFAPHCNHFLGQGALWVGVQETGKTAGVARLLEQAGACYLPYVVFDLKGEYYTITGVVKNGIRAGHPDMANEIGPGYFELTVENAKEFATAVLEYGFQAIVHLPSYGTQDEMGKVISAVLDQMLAISRATSPDKRVACLLVVDEAHYFLPERQELASLSKDVFQAMQQSFFKMVNIGRSYGFTVILATQRMANILKWAIANLQIKFIMKQVEKNDLNTCQEIVRPEIATRDQISSLPRGHAIVVAPDGDQFIVCFHKRISEHFSHTPQLESVHRKYKTKETSLLDEWQELTGELLEPDLEDDREPNTDEIPVAQTRQEITVEEDEVPVPIIPEKGKRAEDIDLDVAVLLWNAGHNTIAEIMKAFKLTNHQARRLREMILARAESSKEGIDERMSE